MRRWLAVFALALGGCALDADQCRHMDWRARGQADAEDGRSDARFGEYRAQCGKFGQVPDREAYQQGWDAGNARYCEPANGYALGRRGQDYRGVCRGAGSHAFMQQYERGVAVYRYEQQVEALERDIRAAEREREALYRQLHERRSDALRYRLLEADRQLQRLQMQRMRLQMMQPRLRDGGGDEPVWPMLP